jgi:hypothetical protein
VLFAFCLWNRGNSIAWPKTFIDICTESVNMKKLLVIGLVACTVWGCKEPMQITANPSDHTNASGTLGSAKMTTEMPPKANNQRVPDTIRKDQPRKDSMK